MKRFILGGLVLLCQLIPNETLFARGCYVLRGEGGTPNYLALLQDGSNWAKFSPYNDNTQPYYFKWSPKGNKLPSASSLSGKYTKVGNGQCVNFVQLTAGFSTPTGSWTAGRRVMDMKENEIIVGTIVATFVKVGNKLVYKPGHCGAYIAHNRQTKQLSLWDQNFVGQNDNLTGISIVGRHRMTGNGGSSATRVDDYYILQIP